MLVPRQQYSRELKIACMRELDSGKSMAEIARQYQLSPKRLETWKAECLRLSSNTWRTGARRLDSKSQMRAAPDAN